MITQTPHLPVLDSDALLEGLRSAIVVVDSVGIVQRVNLAAETLFCQSRRHLIGHQLGDLIPDETLHKCFQECLRDSTQFTLREVELLILDQESLVDITLSSVSRPGDNEPFVLIEVNSINRISRFMKEKNQLERQQSFRMMMRGLAHEIKNPLGGIRGAAQLLDRELEDPSQQELTDILIKEADRLTRLVDRVMGSREQLKPTFLNIHEVLEHVVHVVSVKFQNQVMVHRFYDPALPEIMVDREQMIQAVLNVVGNAVEAQEGWSQITVGLNTQFERFVTINQTLHRQVLKIQIWDRGPGVADDMRAIIFDPLISGRAEGSGLGLSITQEIIQRHQGVVQLEDHLGNTCFAIYLPYINHHNNEAGNA